MISGRISGKIQPGHELDRASPLAPRREQIVISVEPLRGCWAEARPVLPAAARAKIGGAFDWWDSAEAARSGSPSASHAALQHQRAAAMCTMALRYD